MDLIIIATYLVFLIIIGLKKSVSDSNFFLADRKMTSKVTVLSVLATETSGASLLLFPNLGFNPEYRFVILQLVLGLAIGRFLVTFIFVPFLYQSISIYDYLRQYIDQF